MITEFVVSELFTAILRYNQAVDRNAGISLEKERVKNLLFNYKDEIYEMMDQMTKGSGASVDEVEELRNMIAVKDKMIETLTQKLNERNAKKKEPPTDKG